MSQITSQPNQIFVIPDSVNIDIRKETYAKRTVFEIEIPESTQESFIVPEEQKRKYLAKIFKLAKEKEGEHHNFHVIDSGVACWDSTPARTDYDDAIDCEAFYSFNNVKIQYGGNIYDVEGAADKNLYAFREVQK